MHKHELNTKVEKFFNENNITKIHKDPTLKFQKQFNKLIKKTKQIIQPESTKHLKQIKSNPPKLNALPKIRKPKIPIRPLTNNTQAPSHKIAIHLYKIILSLIHIYPNLINKLHKHIINKNNKTLNTNNTQQTKYITLTYHNLSLIHI